MALKNSVRKVRVMIADDQTLFREGLKDLLEGEKGVEVVGEASDGEEAVRLAKKLKPNVILMDIKLPKLDGILATKQVRSACPDTNVLMLSTFEDEAHVMEAIQAGANGYLSKMLPATELVSALMAFAHEGMMIPQPVMGKILSGLRQRSGEKRPPLEALTETEVRVLASLGKGLSNKEMSSNLRCSIKTVKNHLNAIFQKLDVTNRTEAVIKGIERGLISSEGVSVL